MDGRRTNAQLRNSLLRQRLCGRNGLIRARGGLAALEFALIAPVLFTLLAGSYDLTTAYIAWDRVNLCAQAIDQIATSEAANSVKTNTMQLSQATTAASAAYAYLPNLLGNTPTKFGVTISSIVMNPTVQGCTVNCTYQADVAWSGIYAGTLGTQRPCDASQGSSAITQTSDSAPPSPTTLPADVYSASPLLVVDVVYKFQPIFLKFLSGSFTMAQSAYYPPRTGLQNNWIQYVYASPDSTALCAGYPSA